ncbi:MAG TPA: hypothetical protein DCW83_08815 [Saprospirales bacterium]|nr:hypothetical protein [Saprospirales bacterium]
MWIQKMRLLQLTRKILLISIFPVTVWANSPIGDITEQTGIGSLTRAQNELVAEVGRDIELYDTLNTGNGRIAVEFVDNAELRLTEHSRVLIDEVIYDPDPSKSKMAMKFAMGTARFTSGKLGMINKANIRIETPTATIGIRGTDFTTTVDELGRSLIILLPDLNGNASGEITVTNEGGEVILNEAYQATMVSTISTPPVRPVTITNITVAQIDNLFIVSPPAEVQQAVQEEASENSKSNVFTADFLEFNELEKDHLDKRELEYTELDMDLLDVDFLQDMLSIIEEGDLLSRKKSKGFDNVNITGTAPGFDKESQYNTIVDASGQIWFYREVTGIISIKMPIHANASISTITDEKESLITVGDGYAVSIIIRQTN